MYYISMKLPNLKILRYKDIKISGERNIETEDVERKSVKKSIFLFFVFSSLFIVFAQSAKGQLQQQSITITPPTIQLNLNPGDKKEGTLGIINDSDKDLNFIRVVDYTKCTFFFISRIKIELNSWRSDRNTL